MTQVGLVCAAEFARKLRSRVFLVATVGGAFMVALLLQAPQLFERVAESSTSAIVLAGPPDVRARAAALMSANDDFEIVAQTGALPEHVTAAYLRAHGKAAAAIAVSERGRRLHLEVYARDLAAFDDMSFRSLVPLNLALQTGESTAHIASATKIDRTIHGIDTRFTSSKNAEVARGVAFGLIFILYFAIIIASQAVMASVAEEKTSRIAEILVATIEPVDLLAGKTLAAAALAVVQIAVWVGTAALLLPSSLESLGGGHAARASLAAGNAAAGAAAANAPGFDVSLLEPGVFVAFAVFFVLGYLQYATVYAAAASLISRTEDLGSVTTPVILPVVGAFFAAQYALIAPSSAVATTLSFVPFISPFVIFSRIAISNVPPWQLAVAVAINVATVLAAFFVAGRIYRVGMLLYGRLPSPKQVWAALRT